MTEKRFTITKGFDEHERQIRDNGKIIMGCFIQPQAEPIVKLLNELAEENRYLKEALKELKEIGDYQAMRIQELQEFEDTVFNSLDGKIKRGEKAIEWGESVGADIGAMGFHIELLKQFKKELSE